MRPWKRYAGFSLWLALATLSSAGHATCWESGEGATAVYRDPTVATEFKDAPYVLTGRVLSARHIATPDDPEGVEWTVYTIRVLETFKGKAQPTIRLVSENTSARFDMDIGASYLLFVRHVDTREMAGKERLPADFVDNCGNSALVKDAGQAIRTVRRLSTGP
ncbi:MULTISPECIES: hypothetical protein [Dyella]|uniref:Uncharacterized protein n=2 Tax=Dyella TaxID=231454 RepID=A0A4V2NM40_9GAMM|nr:MULTISPECIES: hypothetical protein [Dyella]TBR40571.1 hypothetical protein EYV96_10580 [Dyella terrae]TCI11847.1 hypothetical protein EZM97_00290 [Dyella soli]